LNFVADVPVPGWKVMLALGTGTTADPMVMVWFTNQMAVVAVGGRPPALMTLLNQR
jgi:hypothetical protein